MKELERSAKDARRAQDVPRIIPGDWGMVEPGWFGATPLSLSREIQRPEAGFTSSSGSVRALSVNAKKELSGEKR